MLLTVLLLLALPVASDAATDATAESRLVALVNRARADHGLAALRVAGDLRAVARRHSARMADRGRVSHNDRLGEDVTGWRRTGENVGRGPDAPTVHRAFMDSSSHRRNVLSPHYREVGIGVERRGDTIWVTQVFREPSGESASPAPADPPPAEQTPEPRARQTPAPQQAVTASPPARPDAAETPQPAPTEVTVDRLTVVLARIEAVEDAAVSVEEALAA